MIVIIIIVIYIYGIFLYICRYIFIHCRVTFPLLDIFWPPDFSSTQDGSCMQRWHHQCLLVITLLHLAWPSFCLFAESTLESTLSASSMPCLTGDLGNIWYFIYILQMWWWWWLPWGSYWLFPRIVSSAGPCWRPPSGTGTYIWNVQTL